MTILMFADAGVSMGIYDIAKSLTYPGWGVIITLLIQSVYMIAVGIERMLTYNKAKQQSRQYAPKVAQALKNSNIDEAINIPLYFIRLKLATLDQAVPYVVCCDTGRRSAAAAYILVERGFEAYVLDGGLSQAQSVVRRSA